MKIAPSKKIINNTIEIILAICLIFIAAFNAKNEATILNTIPMITGTVTIRNMLMAILVNEIFKERLSDPRNLIEVTIIKGTVITLNKLIIAVSEIERATSPLAKEVSILEVTPPGAAAIIITPIASSGEMGQILTKINAITGSKII